MSDHADVIREALGLLSSMVASRESHTLTSVERSREAHAALDALVAERDACRESVRSSGEFWLERVKAAEAERDEARRERDSWRTLAEGWKLTDDLRCNHTTSYHALVAGTRRCIKCGAVV